MSARAGSRPGTLARGRHGAAPFDQLADDAVQLGGRELEAVVRVQRLGCPCVAWAMWATASAVPDDATATSKPCSSTSRWKWLRMLRTYSRQAATAFGPTAPPGKNRSVSRMAPSFRLSALEDLGPLADHELGAAAADVDEQVTAVPVR